MHCRYLRRVGIREQLALRFQSMNFQVSFGIIYRHDEIGELRPRYEVRHSAVFELPSQPRLRYDNSAPTVCAETGTKIWKNLASGGTRSHDLKVKGLPLYQLSHGY